MKIRKALLLAALLVLGAFFTHIVSMLPNEEDRSRAEALDRLLAEEFPTAPESAMRAEEPNICAAASPAKAARTDAPGCASMLRDAEMPEIAREVRA